MNASNLWKILDGVNFIDFFESSYVRPCSHLMTKLSTITYTTYIVKCLVNRQLLSNCCLGKLRPKAYIYVLFPHNVENLKLMYKNWLVNMVAENLFVFILLRYVFVVFTYFTHELTANQLFRNQNFNIENLLFLFVQAVIAKNSYLFSKVCLSKER